MGKGDQKTKRGKIISGSYGVSRPKRKKKIIVIAKSEAPVKQKKEKPVKEVEETKAIQAELAGTEITEPVAAEAPVKKKSAKTAKKSKTAEPELELGIEEKDPESETPEIPAEG